MIFLVGTHSYLIMAETGQCWQLNTLDLLADGHHYGIALTTDDGNEFVAKGGRGEILTIYKFDYRNRKYQPQKHIELGRQQYGYVHQIACVDGGLYLANTDFNRLDYLSLQDFGATENCSIGGVHYDVNHLNSVFPLKNDTVLCLLHNRGRVESEIAVVKWFRTEGFRVIKRLPLWDYGCHNLFLESDLLVYNASNKGDVVGVDLKQERIGFRIRLPGHTKGLSVLDDYFIVGFSEFAEREDRKESNGYLAVIDRRTLKWVATADLNQKTMGSPAGNVNEVRCVSTTDYGQKNFPNVNLHLDFCSMRLSNTDIIYQIRKKVFNLSNKLKNVLGTV